MASLSLGQLMASMPKLEHFKAQIFLAAMLPAMERWGIVTPTRTAHWLGQLRVESGSLRYWKEISPPGGGMGYDIQGSNPELARALGNTRPGDGIQFIGRGPIQLTGRANYRSAGLATGYPLDEHPELLEQPVVGFQAAGWFWASRSLNLAADQDKGDVSSFHDTVHAITLKINGGLTNFVARLAATGEAKAALRISEPPTPVPDFGDVEGGHSTK
jgi:putative chitinase